MSDTIDGPLGPFKIPTSAHPRTREVCEYLSRQVFGDAETLGEYDSPELPSFENFPPAVIDVGAGWGAFSVWARKKWPGCGIFCYEPHDAAADVLVANTSGNPLVGSVALVRAAVTTDPAPRMNGAEDWGAHHISTVDDTCAWPVRGIHPRVLPPCDVLKMDCEGSETEVMEHYPHLATCRALLIEFHTVEKRARVTGVALEAGFVRVKAAPENASYGVDVWVKS